MVKLEVHLKGEPKISHIHIPLQAKELRNHKHKFNTVGTKDTIIDLSSELKYQLHLPPYHHHPLFLICEQ